jgi:uncharacterized protein (UPF0548 family)
MLSIRFPDEFSVAAFRLREARGGFSYPDVGGTRAGRVPAGYAVTRTRAKVGEGPAAFVAAREVLRGWGQFPRPWAVPAAGGEAPRAGLVVAVLARAGGVWWANACRVVDVTDEPGRYAFSYGTLAGHAAAGEERFQVELRPDGSVWYEVWSFSRPRHWLMRLGYPLARRVQRRFGRASADRVRRAVAGTPAATGGPVAGAGRGSDAAVTACGTATPP